jgi:two-component system sensor kinase FixL
MPQETPGADVAARSREQRLDAHSDSSCAGQSGGTEERVDRWFEHLLESAPDALILVGSRGEMLLVNRQTEVIFGYAREELVGQPVEMLIPERFRGPHEDYRRKFFSQPRIRPISATQGLIGLRRSGAEFPVEISLSPVESQGGTIVACAIRDISDRVRAEQLLKQRQDELAHVARLATVGELATGLAHELNQPLYSISNYARGCLRRLQDAALDPTRLREILHEIVGEADRAAKIIRRLRRMVQKREPVCKLFNLNYAIQEACALSNSILKKDAVELIRQLDPQLPKVYADEVQIQQVLLNLVRNGVEAMRDTPSAERVLQIRTSAAAPGELRVDVTDAGCGIGDEDLERVFDAFHTTRTNGMGMGLAISRSIVEMHGGRIWAANNPEQGATFSFTLPLAAEESHGRGPHSISR